MLREISTAESRGPGVRHRFEDSGDDYEMELDPHSRGMGGRSGRIILLGDGREKILTESDDTEMFDHIEEDKDLESQVVRGHPQPDDDHARSEREETPGPQPQPSNETHRPENNESANISGTPTSTRIEKSTPIESAKGEVKAIPESAIPEKLVSPAKT